MNLQYKLGDNVIVMSEDFYPKCEVNGQIVDVDIHDHILPYCLKVEGEKEHYWFSENELRPLNDEKTNTEAKQPQYKIGEKVIVDNIFQSGFEEVGEVVNTNTFGDSIYYYQVKLNDKELWFNEKRVKGLAEDKNEKANELPYNVGDIVEYIGERLDIFHANAWKIVGFSNSKKSAKVVPINNENEKPKTMQFKNIKLINKSVEEIKVEENKKEQEQITKKQLEEKTDDMLLAMLTSNGKSIIRLEQLKNDIDIALDNNDKDLFMKLSNELLVLQS